MMMSSNWADQIWDLTPVEERGWFYFKRDDLFAPMGIGGINGAKLRQCIWLLAGAAQLGAPGVVSGSSVKSPQLMMTTIVAAQFGMKSHHVIGVSKFPGALRHVSVDIAQHYGATFESINVAYNPALQRRVKTLLEKDYKGWFYMEYGITLDHKRHEASRIRNFHRVGAEQVRNLPSDVEQIIISTGSYNSATSVLYGIHLFPPPNLKEVVLLQIGPNKERWLRERLKLIDPTIDPHWVSYNLMPHWSYQDEQPFDYAGIIFHPTYEGKCMKYLVSHPEIVKDNSCFWIVGAQVDRQYLKEIKHDYERVGQVSL